MFRGWFYYRFTWYLVRHTDYFMISHLVPPLYVVIHLETLNSCNKLIIYSARHPAGIEPADIEAAGIEPSGIEAAGRNFLGDCIRLVLHLIINSMSHKENYKYRHLFLNQGSLKSLVLLPCCPRQHESGVFASIGAVSCSRMRTLLEATIQEQTCCSNPLDCFMLMVPGEAERQLTSIFFTAD